MRQILAVHVLLSLGLVSGESFADTRDRDDDDARGARATGDGGGLTEFTFFLRTKDDPNVLPDLAVCERAGFPTNVVIGATLWAPKERLRDATIVREFAKQVGTGTACFLFTDLRFPVGSRIRVFASFNLPDGTYSGGGECLVTSNATPELGVLLTGCTAGLSEMPAGVIGGIASTTTLINAYRVPGYVTGSYITIRGFRLEE